MLAQLFLYAYPPIGEICNSGSQKLTFPPQSIIVPTCHHSLVLPVLVFHINEISKYVHFYVWSSTQPIFELLQSTCLS
jgi:hypothetical protein